MRAFAIFTVLLVALLGLGSELAFRELSLNVLRDRLDLGRREARAIADEVVGLLPQWRLEDDAWLDRNRLLIERLIHARIRNADYIHHVELRDGAGRRLVRVAGEAVKRRLERFRAQLPAEWPTEEETIQVPIDEPGSPTLGAVRLTVSAVALQDELIELRQSLRLQIYVSGAVALMLLFIGLLYLLYLLKKNRDLEQARQSAARASYVGLLASGLAHEIRNPLNAMNMNLQMLEEELMPVPESVDPEHRELMESTKSEIKRLERLVNNFLAYARPAQPRFDNQDLNVLAAEVVRFLDADFRQHEVTLQADLEPLLPQVEIDAPQMKQALMNLMVNARQVLSSGGAVTIRSRAGSQGEVVIEIEDDGPGIPEEARARIFEVFYSSRGGGTGLGLPIAKQIVERHGGTIDVDSEVGVGTTFRIRLPRRHRRQPPKQAPS
jgi:signal transduction histidine kinase